jgi:hypothetical protein
MVDAATGKMVVRSFVYNTVDGVEVVRFGLWGCGLSMRMWIR